MVGGSGIVQAWRQLAKLGALDLDEAPQRVDGGNGMVDWHNEYVCLAVRKDGLQDIAALVQLIASDNLQPPLTFFKSKLRSKQ